MTKTEIKKTLYLEKPIASFIRIKSGLAHYITKTSDGTEIFFEVPVSDMGEGEFLSNMPAQHLNRWILAEE